MKFTQHLNYPSIQKDEHRQTDNYLLRTAKLLMKRAASCSFKNNKLLPFPVQVPLALTRWYKPELTSVAQSVLISPLMPEIRVHNHTVNKICLHHRAQTVKTAYCEDHTKYTVWYNSQFFSYCCIFAHTAYQPTSWALLYISYDSWTFQIISMANLMWFWPCNVVNMWK